MAGIILSHGLCLVGEGERKGSLFLSGENLFDGRHCSKWKKIQDMTYVWGGEGLLLLSVENC